MPFGELVVELLLGVGAALFAANLAVVLRHRYAKDPDALPPRPPTGRLVTGMVVGGVVAMWALATLIAAR